MEDDSYSDTPAAPAATEEAAPEETADDTETSALIPKSLLRGKAVKPGQKLTLQVEHVYEDEVEVSCVGEAEAEPETEMSKAHKGLDSIAGDY